MGPRWRKQPVALPHHPHIPYILWHFIYYFPSNFLIVFCLLRQIVAFSKISNIFQLVASTVIRLSHSLLLQHHHWTIITMHWFMSNSCTNLLLSLSLSGVAIMTWPGGVKWTAKKAMNKNIWTSMGDGGTLLLAWEKVVEAEKKDIHI